MISVIRKVLLFIAVEKQWKRMMIKSLFKKKVLLFFVKVKKLSYLQMNVLYLEVSFQISIARIVWWKN
jgi:hypothetical protein